MTKEELEKEADKYADGYATPDLEDSFRAYMFEASKEGYLAGAEPREKRIEELENEVDEVKLKSGYSTYLEDKIKIDELEKQNKKLLESCAGATMMYEDLCKAKEIIKNLMKFAEMDCREYEKEYKEAEQFISKVEE